MNFLIGVVLFWTLAFPFVFYGGLILGLARFCTTITIAFCCMLLGANIAWIGWLASGHNTFGDWLQRGVLYSAAILFVAGALGSCIRLLWDMARDRSSK